MSRWVTYQLMARTASTHLESNVRYSFLPTNALMMLSTIPFMCCKPGLSKQPSQFAFFYHQLISYFYLYEYIAIIYESLILKNFAFFQVFLPFIFVTLAISLCLVLIPLVKSPSMHYIYVFLFVLSGLLFYIPLVYFKLKLVWYEKMICYSQLLFNICIPDVSNEQVSEQEPKKINGLLKTHQVPNKDWAYDVILMMKFP